MRPVAARLLTVAAFSMSLAIAGIAQDKPATAITNDPRVGLKAGLPRCGAGGAKHGAGRDDAAGRGVLRSEGARGRADGGGNRGNRAGRAGDAGAPSAATAAAPAPTPPAPAPPDAAAPATPPRPAPPSGLDFANSDLAFRRADMFIGNFNGFNTYDIETPKKPRLLASVVCPGGQGDMSVYGNLLFMSVEQTRGRVDCGTQGVTDAVEHRAVPRRPHLRHQRHQQAEAGGRGPDLPRLAHPHAGDRSEGPEQHLRLRLGHRPGPARRGARRLLEQRRRTTIRTPRSSAST